MRKKCNRKVRPLGLMMAPDKHSHFVLVARMYFDLIVAGNLNPLYFESIQARMDVAYQIATLKNRTDIVKNMEVGILVIQNIYQKLEIPTQDEKDLIYEVLDSMDNYMSLQQEHFVLKAISNILEAKKYPKFFEDAESRGV